MAGRGALARPCTGFEPKTPRHSRPARVSNDQSSDPLCVDLFSPAFDSDRRGRRVLSSTITLGDLSTPIRHSDYLGLLRQTSDSADEATPARLHSRFRRLP